MIGLNSFKNGFYQGKCRAITESVVEYARMRGEAESDDLSARRSDIEGLLARLAVESGLREEQESFLSVEGEFFTADGELDFKRLNNFTLAVLSGYTLQDLKWSFAGTTACLTPITRRTLTEAGIDPENLLPLPLLHKRRRNLQIHHRSSRTNSDTLFVYPDGRVLNEYIPNAARVTYADLQDRTGFDWRSGYSPRGKEGRRNWLAGFNQFGEWERLNFEMNLPLVRPLPTDDLLRFFTDALDISFDEIYFLSIPVLDEALLFDTRSRLMNDDEQRYYTVTGELYAVRRVDREASLQAVKKQLERFGVVNLTGIVAGDDSEATESYYRGAFADMVSTETRVYSRSDPELAEKLTSLREEVTARDVSRDIAARLYRLAREERSSEEIYESLVPSTVKAEYEMQLRLFTNAGDLEIFLALPEIEAVLDDEALRFLRGAEVPEEKRDLYSNAVQNLLLNYDPVLQSSQIPPGDVIRVAYDVLVEGKFNETEEISIVGEKPLRQIMQNLANPQVDIPTFRPATAGSGNSYEVVDSEQFDEWIDSSLRTRIPGRFIAEMKEMITGAEVPEAERGDYSLGVQKLFSLYPEISKSTDLDPLETLEIFNEVFRDGKSAKVEAEATIYLATTLGTLIREASEGNSNVVRRIIRDSYSATRQREAAVSLLKESDVQFLRQSTFLHQYELTDLESEEFYGALESIRLPLERSSEFSAAVARLLRENLSSLRQQGISITRAVEAVVSALSREGGDAELKRIVQIVIAGQAVAEDVTATAVSDHEYIAVESETAGPDMPISRGTAHFRKLDLTESESAELSDALEAINMQLRRSAELEVSVTRILRDYLTLLRSRGVSISRTVQAVASALTEKARFPELDRIVRAAIGERTALIDAELTTGLNLFESDDLRQLVDGVVFRKLGLDKKRFADLLELHRRSYRGVERKYVGKIPFRFTSERNQKHYPLTVDAIGPERRIHEVGWVVDFRFGQPTKIGYTELGQQVIPENVKQEINSVFREWLTADHPEEIIPTKRLVRTEQILVGANPELSADRLVFTPGVSVVHLETPPNASRNRELEYAHPFAALGKQLAEIRSGSRSGARTVPKTIMQQTATPRPAQKSSADVAVRKREDLGPGGREEMEQRYRIEKERLARIKKTGAPEKQVKQVGDRIQRTSDDLFSRFVERVEIDPEAIAAPEHRDELFEMLIDRIGGSL